MLGYAMTKIVGSRLNPCEAGNIDAVLLSDDEHDELEYAPLRQQTGGVEKMSAATARTG